MKMLARVLLRYILRHTFLALVLAAGNTFAEKKYDPGVTDTEVKLGQTMPYSGPVSSVANYGKLETGYFQMINDRGGINGRKVRLISLDDGFSPPKTVEQTRRLVEEEEVLTIFGSLGTAPNSAIMRYLNERKVPQIFLATGAAKFYDSKNFPWTMGILLNFQQEAALYANYLLKTKPDAKVALLFQNDDFGRDFAKGFKQALGDKASTLVIAEASYEVTDPTIDSQIVTLQSSGANALLNATAPKFAAQAIRKMWDVGWKPMHFLTFPSSSIATLTPAGLEKSVGILSASPMKDPSDPQWVNDDDVRGYLAFMKKYYADGNIFDQHNLVAYISAFMMARVLARCADELTRENVMKQATSMQNLEVPLLLPGIRVSTSATEYQQIHQMRMRRFDGKRWVSFGDLIDTRTR